jgi:signal transduction histidine kinase
MNKSQERRADVWKKWDWLWKVTFYTSVFVSAALMLFDDNRAAPVWVALLLTGTLLLWHWGGLRLAYKGVAGWDEWNERPILRFIIIIVDIILWFVLVNISPAYYFVLFGLFSQIFRHLPTRYAVAGALLLTTAIIYQQLAATGETFSLTNPTIWLSFFIGLVAIILGIWISAIIEQSTRRRHLIEQLEAAQAELAAAERREGVLEERQRLAREIHDTLAQGFTSIVMHLEAAEQALPDDLDILQKHLDQARATARTSLDQARRVVQDLRPDSLEQRSLPDAIERTAVRWTGETSIPLTTTITGNPIALHPDIEVTLLRATQEALNNIRKHAQATAVQLTLSYMEDVVILDVQDNGVGLNGAAPTPLSGGYGLQAMRERAEICGGYVTLESDPGEGTTVVVTIPISS